MYYVFDFFLCLESECTLFVWILWHIFFIPANSLTSASFRDQVIILYKWNLIIQAGRVEKKQMPLAKVVSVAGRSRISVAPSAVWTLNQPRGQNRCKFPRNCCDMEKSLVLWKIPSEHTKPVKCGEGDLQIKMWFSFWFQPTKLMTHTLNVPLPAIRDISPYCAKNGSEY